MNRMGPVALLIVGVVLLTMGWDAYRSLGSGVSRLFTGVPTDRAMLLLIVGGFALAAGLGGLSRGSK